MSATSQRRFKRSATYAVTLTWHRCPCVRIVKGGSAKSVWIEPGLERTKEVEAVRLISSVILKWRGFPYGSGFSMQSSGKRCCSTAISTELRRMNRPGLYPVLTEIEKMRQSHIALLAEDKQANGAAELREQLDDSIERGLDSSEN
jgi:hypothetical protein